MVSQLESTCTLAGVTQHSQHAVTMPTGASGKRATHELFEPIVSPDWRHFWQGRVGGRFVRDPPTVSYTFGQSQKHLPPTCPCQNYLLSGDRMDSSSSCIACLPKVYDTVGGGTVSGKCQDQYLLSVMKWFSFRTSRGGEIC